jgi:NAD(P)-dependent dehydrogenase (short-subunit alcohol dehydrogenase family)
MNTKVIIVTGASAGFGFATANALIIKGDIVYAVARRVERMDELKGIGGFVMAMDIANADSINSGVQSVIKEQGKVDILINNAGYGCLGAVEEVDLQNARNQFEVNVFGLARLCQLLIPYMRQAGRGRIINVSSIGARVYEPLCGWYHSSKYALEGLSDCMRLELQQFGIDVVLIRPGFVRSEWDQVAHEQLRRFSQQGAYSDTANTLVNAHLNYLFRYFASDANTIAKTIIRSAEARKPKSRYVCGRFARSFLLARRLLPDKFLDKIFLLMLRYFGKNE